MNNIIVEYLVHAQTVFTMQDLFLTHAKEKSQSTRLSFPLLLPLPFLSMFSSGVTTTISLTHVQLRPRLLLFGCQSAVVSLSFVRNWSGDHDRIISLSKEG